MAAPPATTSDNQRYTYDNVTTLESPTTVKPTIPGVPGAPFPNDVNLADLILERNTAVRAVRALAAMLT
jgi:hypothetical protein